jgi:hypothetical protein
MRLDLERDCIMKRSITHLLDFRPVLRCLFRHLEELWAADGSAMDMLVYSVPWQELQVASSSPLQRYQRSVIRCSKYRYNFLQVF